MNTELQSKVVLVTGASGGIGRAIAMKFAGEGAKLLLHYRSGHDRVKSLQRQIQQVETLALKADLTKESEVRRLFTQSLKRFGRVDTLIANAGWWETRDVPLHKMTLRQWQKTLDGVLNSVFLTLREFLALVAQQRSGNAVLMASTAAVFGEAAHADYAAGKSAIAYGLTRSIKNEIARLAPHTASYCGGRINCICPGWTIVPRNESKLNDANTVRKVTATMALPQIGRPDDVANAAVFLSSDTLARHLTGQTLVIAGGMEGRMLWQNNEIDPTIV
jgi:3-oxoacyl-[acyl-carrier protein] reductase